MGVTTADSRFRNQGLAIGSEIGAVGLLWKVSDDGHEETKASTVKPPFKANAAIRPGYSRNYLSTVRFSSFDGTLPLWWLYKSTVKPGR